MVGFLLNHSCPDFSVCEEEVLTEAYRMPPSPTAAAADQNNKTAMTSGGTISAQRRCAGGETRKEGS